MQLDGTYGSKNPFPNATYGSVFPAANTKNTYARGTKESIAFNANFNSGSGIASNIVKIQAQTQLKKLAQPPVQAPVQIQQVARTIPKVEAPKVETPGTGANRGAVGSLGASSGAGVAGNAQAGLLGSVNTEVQNDDTLLPYQKV